MKYPKTLFTFEKYLRCTKSGCTAVLIDMRKLTRIINEHDNDEAKILLNIEREMDKEFIICPECSTRNYIAYHRSRPDDLRYITIAAGRQKT